MNEASATGDAAKAEFSEQGPLVDFLEKSGAQGVGDLKDGTQHALGQRIHLSVFIRVHRRLIAFLQLSRGNSSRTRSMASSRVRMRPRPDQFLPPQPAEYVDRKADRKDADGCLPAGAENG